MTDFIETRIIKAVRELLTGKMNEILKESQYNIPVIEFENYNSQDIISPVISLTDCELTEKERIIRLNAFTLTITFTLPEMPEGELYCYAYAGAINRALYDNPTLGGIVNRAALIGRKFKEPKKQHCGEGWGLTVTVRVIIEGDLCR